MSGTQLWLSEPIPNDDIAVAGLEFATLWLRILHPNHCAITAGEHERTELGNTIVLFKTNTQFFLNKWKNRGKSRKFILDDLPHGEMWIVTICQVIIL